MNIKVSPNMDHWHSDYISGVPLMSHYLGGVSIMFKNMNILTHFTGDGAGQLLLAHPSNPLSSHSNSQ